MHFKARTIHQKTALYVGEPTRDSTIRHVHWRVVSVKFVFDRIATRRQINCSGAQAFLRLRGYLCAFILSINFLLIGYRRLKDHFEHK